MNDHGISGSQRLVLVRTPENIELSFALAGPGSRAAAYFVDLMIMSFAAQLLINLMVAFFALVARAIKSDSEAWALAISTLVAFAIYNGYFILLEWLMNGQTPGKRLLHIRVIKQGGYALRFVDTLTRNLLRIIDFLPLFYGVGLSTILITRDSQRLGDLVAGTLVVYQEPVETESLLVDLDATAESEFRYPAARIAAIPGDAIALVDEYLRARADLGARPRQEIAAELVDLIGALSGLEPAPTQGAESFLTAIVRQGAQSPPSSLQTLEGVELPS